jgi:hypothetical protein
MGEPCLRVFGFDESRLHTVNETEIASVIRAQGVALAASASKSIFEYSLPVIVL